MSAQDTTTAPAVTRRAEFTAGLRAMADWFDSHPEIELPYETTPFHHSGGVRFSIGVMGWRYDDEAHEGVDVDVAQEFAAAVRALGGARTKEASDAYMRVTRQFGPGLNLEVWAERDEVCEAVVVGKKRVEVEKVVTPAVTEKVIETRDVIEWRCTPVLDTNGAA